MQQQFVHLDLQKAVNWFSRSINSIYKSTVYSVSPFLMLISYYNKQHCKRDLQTSVKDIPAWDLGNIKTHDYNHHQPLMKSSDTVSVITFTPSCSITTSSSLKWESNSNLYWKPLQPPPSTVTRRLSSAERCVGRLIRIKIYCRIICVSIL